VGAVLADGVGLAAADTLGLAITEAVGFGLKSCPTKKATTTATTATPPQKTTGIASAIERGVGGVGEEIGGVPVVMIRPCFSGKTGSPDLQGR